MRENPLDASDIRDYLVEVAQVLPDDCPQQVIVIVGGSLLAWLGLRETTADVDSVKRIESALREAVAEVAHRHGLSERWLNDAAAGFVPATFDEQKCSLLLEDPRLRVLGAPLQQVFVMKLFAARASDFDDLVVIWDRCGFNSPEEAAELFHSAYPHLERDEFLADHIRGLADSS